MQAATKNLGQFVTGSCVNAVLAAATLLGGFASGLIVAVVSPFLAFLLGIGPKLIEVVPAIAIGNLALVLILWAIKGDGALHSRDQMDCRVGRQIPGLVSAGHSVALPSDDTA